MIDEGKNDGVKPGVEETAHRDVGTKTASETHAQVY
jgi:hypothetical protein